jgi:hypothetical protein
MDFVERVARAICTSRGGDPDLVATKMVLPQLDGLTYLNLPEWALRPAWEFYTKEAEAVARLVHEGSEERLDIAAREVIEHAVEARFAKAARELLDAGQFAQFPGSIR